MLEKMEEAIKNGQSRDTENIGHKTRNKVKQNRKLKRKATQTSPKTRDVPLLNNIIG